MKTITNDTFLFKNSSMNPSVYSRLNFLEYNDVSLSEIAEKNGFSNFNKRLFSIFVNSGINCEGNALDLSRLTWGSPNDFCFKNDGFNFKFKNKKFKIKLVLDPHTPVTQNERFVDPFDRYLNSFGVNVIVYKQKNAPDYISLNDVKLLISKNELNERVIRRFVREGIFKIHVFDLDEALFDKTRTIERIRNTWENATYLEQACDFSLIDNCGKRVQKTKENLELYGALIVKIKINIPTLAVYERIGKDLIYTGFSCNSLKELVCCYSFFNEYCDRRKK